MLLLEHTQILEDVGMHRLCSDEYVSEHEGVRKSIGSTRLGSAELVGWRSSPSVPGPECSQWSKAEGSKQSILHGNLPVGAFALRFVSYKSNSYNQVLDLSVYLFFYLEESVVPWRLRILMGRQWLYNQMI